MDPLTSAKNEAFEEAGLLGKFYPSPTSLFKTEKWDADAECLVEVFLMKVTKTVKEYTEANLRKRKWFLLDEAVDQVRTDQIKSIIKQSEPIINRLL